MDLRTVSVFLDFDGTITTVDTGVHLLDRLAPKSWRQIEELYKSGRIGSRECMVRQWQLLPRDRSAIEATVAEVPLDEGVVDLVDHLRSGGAEVTILSDGYGFRAEEVGRELGVAVITNGIDWDAHEVLFPNGSGTCACADCGTCKRAPIEAAQRRGRRTVLVGDGASDSKAAAAADVVFAKAELARWCRSNGIGFRPFDCLADVLVAMRVDDRDG